MADSIENLREALAEIRNHRSEFSPKSFETIVTALLEKIQSKRTITETKNDGVTADEIRLVTVMFVDVVESTRLSQRMDRGDWKDLISNAHNLMANSVLEAEGNVGQFLGDGMLCYFGAQHSRSDDALRAANCALTIQTQMQDYAEEAMRRYHMATGFAIRISLSTGRVVVGMIGTEDKQELLALGPATNLASRLQSFAAPKTTVIDAQTQRRVRTHFKLKSHEPVQVKGFEEMVAYYTVLDKVENPQTDYTNNQIMGRTIPFVARTDEAKEILDIWWESQISHQFKVVSILGEIGIGKSRLLQYINEQINQQPVTQIHLFADYERHEMSHNLLRNLLIRNCNLSDDTPIDIAKEKILAYITQTWNDPDAQAVGNVLGIMYINNQTSNQSSDVVQRSGHLNQRMIFSWVARWFAGMAQSSPLLIVVDNLQWIDSLSVELLEYLAIALQDQTGMILAAGRSDVRIKNSGYMYSVPNHTTVSLSPLDTPATIHMIKQVLSDVQRVNDMVVNSIAERANGNPLFVREFLNILFDNGVISRKDDDYRFNMGKYYTTVSELPSGLTGVLQARLDELSAQARVIVQAAATVGQRFWSGVIDEMVDFEVDRYLEELVQRGIIYQNPETSFEGEREYQFRHSLYQEVALQMLPRSQRENYHSMVTRWMVTRMAGKPEYFPMLADQFSKAAQHQAALFTYLEAIQNRQSRGLLDETLSLIERGLAEATDVPREIALTVTSQMWTIRAQTYNALNRFGEASAAAESALKLLEELPYDQLLDSRVTAARILGLAYRSMGQYDKAFDALSHAFNMIPHGDSMLLAHILGAFGSLTMYQGKLAECLAYQQRAYFHAEKTEQRTTLTGNLTQLGLIAFEKGNLDQALDYFERVLEVNLNRENLHYQILDLRNIGATYLALFDYGKAISTFEQAQELEDYISYRDTLLQAYRAQALIEVGRIEEGIREMEDAVQRGHKDIYHNLQIQLVQLEGWVKIQQYDDALPLANRVIEASKDLNPILYGRGLLWKGLIYQSSDPVYANELLEQALDFEVEYAGLYTWACHNALAQTSSGVVQEQHYNNARDVLTSIGMSLNPRPEIQAQFLESDVIRRIKQQVGMA